MDYIKVTQVLDVTLYRKGFSVRGTIHLTTNHLIFTLPTEPSARPKEMWICYPIIERIDKSLGSALLEVSSVQNQFNQPACDSRLASPELSARLYRGANIRLRCKDFTYYSLDFDSEPVCQAVYETLVKLVACREEKLYAFLYAPVVAERQHNGWMEFDIARDFARQGAYAAWRETEINVRYEFCPTYPAMFLVPRAISDLVLKHCGKFRSKGRIPALSYYHRNGCVVTRCAQPLVGLKKQRSIQDERLVAEIFGDRPQNLIVDLRPLANAMAQTALGAGTENVDNYGATRATRIFLNIDNIHVMRDTLARVVEALKNGDVSATPVNAELLGRLTWLKHTSIVLAGVDRLAKSIHLNAMNMLVHCSDGWDRTAQVCSLLQLCLDPHYRTLRGFMLLVEKEWCAFGHQFAERSDHVGAQLVTSLGASRATSFFSKFKVLQGSNFKSPTFHQFLDCVYQMARQHPTAFEFNERFLRRLLYHVYSCQYGTFLVNNERQKVEQRLEERTRSVWDYFTCRLPEFTNPQYTANPDVIYPNCKDVKWWFELFGRTDAEMNVEVKESKSPASPSVYVPETKNEGAVKESVSALELDQADGPKEIELKEVELQGEANVESEMNSAGSGEQEGNTGEKAPKLDRGNPELIDSNPWNGACKFNNPDKGVKAETDKRTTLEDETVNERPKIEQVSALPEDIEYEPALEEATVISMCALSITTKNLDLELSSMTPVASDDHPLAGTS
ncbi:hypothetical protein BABINDRAFT_162615 [Babjeviella inositovora NRRL Y-12698]|uniref:Myotubularin phosphatase domain-containing protein n=1 Tax=Babjeviella inositovora NRRL Y-12698 TaxID=984486 RepID=A0A1E3QL04_9ASCO|nr:uncharacterized protein BABINDRAFT_162615 [Babjeviella inositovora NRRL Y-12698]ODQ78376.1 hypothetical protein BABINDRAFT_162615 [Babjeviella inositovora NRRL Y-12698]